LTRSGRYNMNTLKEVMLPLIANTGPLSREWRDHERVGDWSGHRECHVGGDFPLIYWFDGDTIIFVGAGTHSELFE
jgi:mRNA interferase YafQ